MRIAVAAALLAATASPVAAQPALTAPIERAPDVKNEQTATLLAVGTTLSGLALAGAGTSRGNGEVVLAGMMLSLIGPSAGHFYAGETGHGVKMTLVRTGGAIVLGMGVIASMNTALEGRPCPDCSTGSDDHSTAKRMIWIGGATIVMGTLYDLWDAHNAAHRTNMAAAAARGWTLAPTMMTGASGTTAPGLAIGGGF